MAFYDQPLTSLDQNWGGDASTGNLRVVGDRIQALLVSEIRSRATNADMGSKTDLTTTDKSTLVAAVNEVKASVASQATATDTKIGTLSSLTTTNKTSLVAAINEACTKGGGGSLNTVTVGTAEYTDIW